MLATPIADHVDTTSLRDEQGQVRRHVAAAIRGVLVQTVP